MDNSDLTFCPLARTEATRLSAINRACPIEADFALVFDRGQDFFRWPDLIYDRYQYLGAFCDGELAGYLMLGLFTGWTGEEFGTCAYLGDARVLPRFRGRHLTQHMMSAMEALVPAEAQLGLSLEPVMHYRQ
jgi:GNAT superfamily N-acetyltransferase